MDRLHSDGFPWLSVDDHYEFPDCSLASPEGIVGVGGNLSPGMLLSAYRQGVFPWFDENDPVIWWCPDPRFVLLPGEVHVSSSMGKVLRAGRFRYTIDHEFGTVIHLCAASPRKGQRGTWITGDMELAYRRLHELGYAHSCEVWEGDEIVGGLYGVAIGRMFFGESMFSRRSNASKAALIAFCRFLSAHGFDLVDAQQETGHLERMGGRALPREQFLTMVRERVDLPGMHYSWSEMVLEPEPG